MPASQTGFSNLFLERNLRMPAGYHQMGVLGCPPGMQQQQSHHLAAIAGVPVAYSGLQGYNFIPYPHHRHITHMNNTFDLKAAASPYHQALLGRGGPFYPLYRPGAAEDHSRGAKVATRESTSALKAWLNEHLKNPYPTKGEKIMLAIVTKMSLTQVSTWFANARRRLKKENRVSWASKGKSDEEDEGESEDEGAGQKSRLDDEDEMGRRVLEDRVKEEVGTENGNSAPKPLDARLIIGQTPGDAHGDIGRAHEKSDSRDQTGSRLESKENGACLSLKPKIWSLAETAISETVSKTKDSSPLQNHGPEVGKWWAEWTSRNGIFIPACYSAHDLL